MPQQFEHECPRTRTEAQASLSEGDISIYVPSHQEEVFSAVQ